MRGVLLGQSKSFALFGIGYPGRGSPSKISKAPDVKAPEIQKIKDMINTPARFLYNFLQNHPVFTLDRNWVTLPMSRWGFVRTQVIRRHPSQVFLGTHVVVFNNSMWG